jgi:hypothetical protein
MTLATRVPLIATMQANRGAAKHEKAELDEVALSDAASQDATLLARIINEKHTPTLAFLIAGAREFTLHGFRLGGVPATDFTFKEIMTEKDIAKAKDGDEKQEEPDAEGEHAKKRQPAARNGKGLGTVVDKTVERQFRSIQP